MAFWNYREELSMADKLTRSYYELLRDELDYSLIQYALIDSYQKFVSQKEPYPFVEKRELTPQVLLLDEIDYNSWIDKVDPSWSGAIPATLIINHKTGQRRFLERELKTGELEQIIKQLTI